MSLLSWLPGSWRDDEDADRVATYIAATIAVAHPAPCCPRWPAGHARDCRTGNAGWSRFPLDAAPEPLYSDPAWVGLNRKADERG